MRIAMMGIGTAEETAIVLKLRMRWPDLKYVRLKDIDEMRRWISDNAPDMLFVGGESNSLCRGVESARAISNKAIIAFSDHPTDEEMVNVLDMGADDYLPTSASGPQIVSRISAVLRRTSPAHAGVEWVHCADLRINMDRYEAFLRDKRLHLTPTEFRILYHLTSNAGKVLTHKTLQDLIWGVEGPYFGGNLRKYIFRLRSKLRSRVQSSIRITSEPRIGYRLET